MRKAVKGDEQYVSVVSGVPSKPDADVVTAIQHSTRHCQRSERNPSAPSDYGSSKSKSGKCGNGNEK